MKMVFFGEKQEVLSNHMSKINANVHPKARQLSFFLCFGVAFWVSVRIEFSILIAIALSITQLFSLIGANQSAKLLGPHAFCT